MRNKESGEETALLGSNSKLSYGSAAEITPTALTWRNVSVRVEKTGRSLLNDVSGSAQPGHLTVLMGASGAGKTTLLNTFSMRNLKGLRVDGIVTLNGYLLDGDMKNVSGYVQQEEMFIPTLTVKEHLFLQANLRLPDLRTSAERDDRVYEILSQLDLLSCQNIRIGAPGVKHGISGGESKRLSFASELLSNPPVLFCDEPTSKLDSFMAEGVVKVLLGLAHSGRTIVCTVHQPASELFYMFDRVIFLAEGRTAYGGSPAGALKFFGSCGYHCPNDFNPADLIIQTLAVVPYREEECRERIDSICYAFSESEDRKAIVAEINKSQNASAKPVVRKQSSYATQLVTIFHSSLLDNFRNPSLARTKFSQKIIIGIFVGLLYFQTLTSSPEQIGIANVNGALFFLVCEFTYSALYGVLTFLPSSFPLLVREYHDGLYCIPTYYLAKALAFLPLFSLDGFVMLLIVYWMIGLATTGLHVLYAVMLGLLIEQTSAAFGLMLSATSPSFPVAISVAGPLTTLLSLTGGLYANVGALPPYIAWVQYLSWFRYGFEAFVINQWSEEGADSCPSQNCTRGDAVLEKFSFARQNFWLDVAALGILMFSFYVIGFFGLLYRVRRAR